MHSLTSYWSLWVSVYDLRDQTKFIKHVHSLQSLGVYCYSYLFIFSRRDNSKNYALGISCIALGFFIFLWKQRHNTKVVSFSTHRYLFAMTLCFYATAIMQWYNLKTYGLVFLAVHQELVVLTVAGFMLYFLKQSPIPFFKLDYIPVMVLVVSFAIVSGVYGLKVTNPFISSIISLTSSIFTIILAVILLKEDFKWYYIDSMLTVLYGAWLLS